MSELKFRIEETVNNKSEYKTLQLPDGVQPLSPIIYKVTISGELKEKDITKDSLLQFFEALSQEIQSKQPVNAVIDLNFEIKKENKLIFVKKDFYHYLSQLLETHTNIVFAGTLKTHIDDDCPDDEDLDTSDLLSDFEDIKGVFEKNSEAKDDEIEKNIKEMLRAWRLSNAVAFRNKFLKKLQLTPDEKDQPWFTLLEGLKIDLSVVNNTVNAQRKSDNSIETLENEFGDYQTFLSQKKANSSIDSFDIAENIFKAYYYNKLLASKTDPSNFIIDSRFSCLAEHEALLSEHGFLSCLYAIPLHRQIDLLIEVLSYIGGPLERVISLNLSSRLFLDNQCLMHYEQEDYDFDPNCMEKIKTLLSYLPNLELLSLIGKFDKLQYKDVLVENDRYSKEVESEDDDDMEEKDNDIEEKEDSKEFNNELSEQWLAFVNDLKKERKGLSFYFNNFGTQNIEKLPESSYLYKALQKFSSDTASDQEEKKIVSNTRKNLNKNKIIYDENRERNPDDFFMPQQIKPPDLWRDLYDITCDEKLKENSVIIQEKAGLDIAKNTNKEIQINKNYAYNINNSFIRDNLLSCDDLLYELEHLFSDKALRSSFSSSHLFFRDDISTIFSRLGIQVVSPSLLLYIRKYYDEFLMGSIHVANLSNKFYLSFDPLYGVVLHVKDLERQTEKSDTKHLSSTFNHPPLSYDFDEEIGIKTTEAKKSVMFKTLDFSKKLFPDQVKTIFGANDVYVEKIEAFFDESNSIKLKPKIGVFLPYDERLQNFLERAFIGLKDQEKFKRLFDALENLPSERCQSFIANFNDTESNPQFRNIVNTDNYDDYIKRLKFLKEMNDGEYAIWDQLSQFQLSKIHCYGLDARVVCRNTRNYFLDFMKIYSDFTEEMRKMSCTLTKEDIDFIDAIPIRDLEIISEFLKSSPDPKIQWDQLKLCIKNIKASKINSLLISEKKFKPLDDEHSKAYQNWNEQQQLFEKQKFWSTVKDIISLRFLYGVEFFLPEMLDVLPSDISEAQNFLENNIKKIINTITDKEEKERETNDEFIKIKGLFYGIIFSGNFDRKPTLNLNENRLEKLNQLVKQLTEKILELEVQPSDIKETTFILKNIGGVIHNAIKKPYKKVVEMEEEKGKIKTDDDMKLDIETLWEQAKIAYKTLEDSSDVDEKSIEKFKINKKYDATYSSENFDKRKPIMPNKAGRIGEEIIEKFQVIIDPDMKIDEFDEKDELKQEEDSSQYDYKAQLRNDYALFLSYLNETQSMAFDSLVNEIKWLQEKIKNHKKDIVDKDQEFFIEELKIKYLAYLVRYESYVVPIKDTNKGMIVYPAQVMPLLDLIRNNDKDYFVQKPTGSGKTPIISLLLPLSYVENEQVAVNVDLHLETLATAFHERYADFFKGIGINVSLITEKNQNDDVYLDDGINLSTSYLLYTSTSEKRKQRDWHQNKRIRVVDEFDGKLLNLGEDYRESSSLGDFSQVEYDMLCSLTLDFIESNEFKGALKEKDDRFIIDRHRRYLLSKIKDQSTLVDEDTLNFDYLKFSYKIYNISQNTLCRWINMAILSQCLKEPDDYIVEVPEFQDKKSTKEAEIVIIGENKRPIRGAQWNSVLHNMVKIKEQKKSEVIHSKDKNKKQTSFSSYNQQRTLDVSSAIQETVMDAGKLIGFSATAGNHETQKLLQKALPTIRVVKAPPHLEKKPIEFEHKEIADEKKFDQNLIIKIIGLSISGRPQIVLTESIEKVRFYFHKMLEELDCKIEDNKIEGVGEYTLNSGGKSLKIQFVDGTSSTEEELKYLGAAGNDNTITFMTAYGMGRAIDIKMKHKQGGIVHVVGVYSTEIMEQAKGRVGRADSPGDAYHWTRQDAASVSKKQKSLEKGLSNQLQLSYEIASIRHVFQSVIESWYHHLEAHIINDHTINEKNQIQYLIQIQKSFFIKELDGNFAKLQNKLIQNSSLSVNEKEKKDKEAKAIFIKAIQQVWRNTVFENSNSLYATYEKALKSVQLKLLKERDGASQYVEQLSLIKYVPCTIVSPHSSLFFPDCGDFLNHFLTGDVGSLIKKSKEVVSQLHLNKRNLRLNKEVLSVSPGVKKYLENNLKTEEDCKNILAFFKEIPELEKSLKGKKGKLEPNDKRLKDRLKALKEKSPDFLKKAKKKCKDFIKKVSDYGNSEKLKSIISNLWTDLDPALEVLKEIINSNSFSLEAKKYSIELFIYTFNHTTNDIFEKMEKENCSDFLKRAKIQSELLFSFVIQNLNRLKQKPESFIFSNSPVVLDPNKRVDFGNSVLENEDSKDYENENIVELNPTHGVKNEEVKNKEVKSEEVKNEEIKNEEIEENDPSLIFELNNDFWEKQDEALQNELKDIISKTWLSEHKFFAILLAILILITTGLTILYFSSILSLSLVNLMIIGIVGIVFAIVTGVCGIAGVCSFYQYHRTTLSNFEKENPTLEVSDIREIALKVKEERNYVPMLTATQETNRRLDALLKEDQRTINNELTGPNNT